MEDVDINLKNYIENEVFPIYKLNGKSHNLEHIKFVLNRAFEISKNYDINVNLLYIAVSYHDIGDHIDRENHEIVSAKWVEDDKKLDKFLSKEEKKIVKEAIEDHRASSSRIPRNIYGKILSSADKNISVDTYFRRAINYSLEHFPEYKKEQHIEESYRHAVEKFGVNGYATKKYYVEDKKYEEYLKELQRLIENKEEFFYEVSKVFEEESNK